jgi:Lrp/AsnC family leucine-responsive transcriptional regulator
MTTRRRSAESAATLKAKARKPLQLSKLLLDRMNVELLRLIRAEPRITVSELGRRVKMSAPAVRERLARLEDSGVIGAWRIDLDPVALGYPVLAYVRVRPLPGQLPRIAELAQRTPQVVECHRVTGEDCFYMKLHVRSVDHLEEVIDRFTPYGQTTTSIIQSSPVQPRGVELRA